MIIKPTYSCQVCQKWFIFPVEIKIIENEYPLCSLRCVFRLCYKIICSYSKKDIDYLKNYYSIENFEKNNNNKVVFMITKKFILSNLSSIKEVYQIS